MKKTVSLLLCLIIMAGALTSCSRPPELSEIKDRLEALIEASYGVNEILFGEGPETYERVSDPRAEMKYYEDSESSQRYYYYYIDDEELGRILSYRKKAYGDDFSYLLVSDKEDTSENCVYSADGLYYTKIDYTEKEYEFYYDSSIPAEYDVVKENITIAEIKEYAEAVYSKDYMNSLYSTLFDGVMISEDSDNGLLTARYIEYTDTDGNVWFMKSNTYEPLMKEKRIFDLSSATVARGSNAKRVRIEVDSYLESTPDEVIRTTINLVLQDGQWYLDNGTY